MDLRNLRALDGAVVNVPQCVQLLPQMAPPTLNQCGSGAPVLF